MLEPALDATHLRACGRDGFRAVLLLEDALGDDVLIADRLDGDPLPTEHGGPWRLISASQYGYSTLGPHPRARVWQEERHRHLPAQSVRWALGPLIHPFAYTLSYLGALRTRRR
jgi:DMSO/TMAO reductase YedYZ molybdopterin-dependent catalytic subunit